MPTKKTTTAAKKPAAKVPAKTTKAAKETTAKPSKRTKSASSDTESSAPLKAPKFDVASIYASDMDDIARRQNSDVSTLDTGPAMSTGMLMIDLQHGGGIRPAWYSASGKEQCAKTTEQITILASAIKAGVPLIEFWDYEGSSKNSKPYIMSIMKGAGVNLTYEQLFGKRDPETGVWIVRPRIRYHSESVGEKFFNYMAATLRSLPDKRFVEKKWWLVFESTKANKAKYSEHADTKMGRKYGNGIWIEAPDGNLQAIFIVDSFPAMNSIANDDEEQNDSLALQARMFSKHIPRVKGRMGEKRVALLGVNQIRDKPMVMYGPKDGEPGGNALMFYSDSRYRNTSRGSGYPLWAKNFNKQFLEVEKSVEFEGGQDQYRYIHSKTIKNKLWTPGREIWFRLWHQDGDGVARGFDPFFDTMQYLRVTGQLPGAGRSKLTLKLHDQTASKTLDWYDLKAWVLGSKEDMIRVSKKAGVKPMSLRSYCFKQLAAGVGEKLYVANMKNAKEEEE